MKILRFTLRSFAGVMLTVVCMQLALAMEAFVVRDIRVEGLQRVEAGTVFATLPVRVGDSYTDEKAAASIRALFGLGLFKDVRIDVQGDVLVVTVEERPTIANVEFSGTKEFDKDTLRKALRDIGLADGRPYDKALLDRAEQELKRQYISRSLYAAEVVTTVTPIERNRVNLSFSVMEGDTAKIGEIKIVGNKAFSDDTLLGLFDLDAGNWLSWYTKSNRYSRTKLNADIETLRSYYLARGFLEFKIDSTQVAISTDKQEISISINVSEGERFVVSKLKFAGNYLGKDEEFQSLVTIKVGESYNADQVAQTSKAFTDYYANFGFAFARADARTDIDRVTNRVEITLVGDPSRRVYVRRINVAGNDRTRDEVIRREFRQFEASWYDGEKIRQSRNRVDRLGYFKEVSIETQPVPDSADQVDLTVTVVEKPTGSVSLGAGLSTAEGLGLSFGFNQDNAFGSGNSLAVEVNTSKYNRTLVLSTTNPYINDDGVSRTVDLFHRTTRPYEDVDSYSIESTGASVRYGVPITESDTVFLGVGVEKTQIVRGSLLPTAYDDFAKANGDAVSGLPLTVGWARDRRNSSLAPTDGSLLRLSGESSIGADLRYWRANAQAQQYFPLSRKLTLAVNGEVALGDGLQNKPYPIFKNYFSGGLGSVRGFQQGSLTTGGQRESNSTATGGAKKFNVNAELLTPFPGAGNDRTLRLYGFLDAGSVFDANEAIQLNSLRSSFGLGISWISPVGPLRIAFARPIKNYDNDKIQTLQFQIGTSF